MYPKKCWITWKPNYGKNGVFEVGVQWHGRPERFYQFEGWQHETIGIAQRHANKIEEEIRSKIFDPQKHKKRGKHAFLYLFKEYSASWLRNYDHMVKTGDRNPEYIKDLYRFNKLFWEPYFGNIDIREINEVMISEFYLSLREQGHSKKYDQNIMDALKKLISDMCRKNKLDVPEFPDYKSKRIQTIPRWLSEKDQDKVLKYVSNIHKPIIMILLYHGLRHQEARELTWNQYHQDRGTITISTLKGGPDREILLDPAVVQAIKEIPRVLHHKFIFHHNGKPYKKNYLWKVFRKALDDARFKDITPYQASRHSAATHILQRGGSTRLVQNILGHADIRTTERYTHIDVRDQERVRRG